MLKTRLLFPKTFSLFCGGSEGIKTNELNRKQILSNNLTYLLTDQFLTEYIIILAFLYYSFHSILA